MLKLARQRRISHTGKCRGSGPPAAARVRNSFVGSIAPPRSGSKPWSKAACRASVLTKEPSGFSYGEYVRWIEEKKLYLTTI